MSALDIALTVILAYFLIRGIFKGLVKEVVGILGLLVAFWAASLYWQAGAEQLKVILDISPDRRGILSFIVIFSIAYFLVGLMSIFIDKIVKLAITPFCSGLVGGALGVLKGSILCVILLTATTIFLKPDNIFYRDSVAWPTISPWCDEVKSWFPETLRNLISQGEKLLRGGAAAPAGQARAALPSVTPRPQGGLNSVPRDYASLVALVKANPQLISQAWRDKIESMTPEQVDAEFLRRFISENRALFSQPAGQGGAPTGAQAPPSGEGRQPAGAEGQAAGQPGPSTWPTPANE
jgi:membrane protein required for colicin V production